MYRNRERDYFRKLANKNIDFECRILLPSRCPNTLQNECLIIFDIIMFCVSKLEPSTGNENYFLLIGENGRFFLLRTEKTSYFTYSSLNSDYPENDSIVTATQP